MSRLDWARLDQAVKGLGTETEAWKRAAREAAPRPDPEDEPASSLWPAGGIALILASAVVTAAGLLWLLPAGAGGILIDGAFLALVLAVLAAVLVDLWAGSR